MSTVEKSSAGQDSVDRHEEETLFTSKYRATELTLDDASELYGSVRLKSMSSVLSLAMLVILILLALALPDQIILLGICAVVVAGFSTLATSWARVQRKKIGKSSLSKIVNTKCVTTLTDSYVRVTADGEEVGAYPLQDLKRVRANEFGCLADFGGKNVAYFQQKGMSRSKFGNLISSLDVILMANKMAKHVKKPKNMPVVDEAQETAIANGAAEIPETDSE